MRRHHHHGAQGQHRPRRTLQKRIFLWFGATILVTAAAVAMAMHAVSDDDGRWWEQKLAGLRAFAAHELARSWDDPIAREALARDVAGDLGVGVILADARGVIITAHGPACDEHAFAVDVVQGDTRVGEARFCMEHTRPSPRRGIVPIAVALLVVWAAAGLIARRLARPLAHLAHVARDLGDGKLATRASVRQREPAEVQMLASALNDMASRIEAHVNDQRTLLAGVSHELRTPLGHVRLLVELARVGASREASLRLDEIEREVVEMDDLVGQLLASARLDFSLDEPRRLDLVEIARRALDRAGESPGLLTAGAERVDVDGDPTLLSRAIANLLQNARAHGGGAVSLIVQKSGDVVEVMVEDAGPGLPPGDPGVLFAPFVRQAERPEKGSLGLGLYLVRRIALAHGGSVVAENTPGGGARVGIRVPAPPTASR